MATQTYTKNSVVAKQGGYIEGLRFDRVISILYLWFVCGAFLDAWAHSHGKVDNTFFTPWHAVLYSGYFVNALAIGVAALLNHLRGRHWLKAIPKGHEFSVIGIPLFIAAGVGDLIWHTLFGFETGIDPLLSPTHLVLGFSGMLITGGALRAAWQRSDDTTRPGWSLLFPAIISLLAIYSLLTFFTEYANPLSENWVVAAPYTNATGARGVIDILLTTAMTMGILLLAIRRWRLPVGTLTLLFGVNTALMSVYHDQYVFIPVFTIVGCIADLLLWGLKPSVKQVGALRLFALLVPITYYLIYFLSTTIFYGRITWTVHLWLGTTVMAGVVGVLLTFLLVPPRVPEG